jgi:hypothetical protein
MNRRWTNHIIVLTALSVATSSAASGITRCRVQSAEALGPSVTYTVPRIEGRRDLRLYDRGGSFDAGLGLDSEWFGVRPGTKKYERNMAALSRVRSFIWEHWRARRRGYVAITLSSVDAAATFHYFIEPDDKGRWRIATRLVRPRSKAEDGAHRYALTRAALTPSGYLKRYVADDEELAADKYALVFGDRTEPIDSLNRNGNYL